MNERQGKDTFILRCDFYSQIKLLLREQRGDLLDAIFAYASGAGTPQMDGTTSMCFEFIRASMDFYADKYTAKCLSLKENGKKGGRPKKFADGSDETERFSEEPNESKETKRFLTEAGGSDETERFSEEPNESKETKNPPFPPITPIPPREGEFELESEYTHSKEEKKGGVGENNEDPGAASPVNAKAAGLLSWIESNVPTIASMREPLTEQNAIWMLRKYDIGDIRRLILTMHSKGAHLRNSNAYAAFVNYAKNDMALKDRPAEKLYTYEEFCDLTDRSGKYTETDFERVVIDGRSMWRKIHSINE